MSLRLFILTVGTVNLSLLALPSAASAQDPNLEVIDNFNSGSEGWEIYDYDGGGAGNVFYPVTWESSGGIGNSGYVWGDDSRWRIDTPETPDSILSFIIYRNWIGETELDLRDARLSVYLRGDQLDLKGANVYFWVLESDDIGHRWHYTANPLQVTQDAWGEKLSFVLDNNESLWHRSWTRSPLVPATLDDILGHVDSYGFSFVGFSEEVTGTFVMDELELRVDTVQPGIFRWQTTGLGDWNGPSNWDAVSVPNSNTDTVIFGTDVSTTTTVVTNASVTAKTIQFDNANGYVIAGSGSVDLQADAGNASVDVLQGDHQFQAVVNLDSETDVNVAASSSLSFNNVLNLSANNLNKTGAGTLHINTILNTSGGSVVVSAGVLSGSGEVRGDLTSTGGTVAPGNSPGKLSVGGNYTQEAGASLAIEINGLAAESEHDVLDVTGSLTINGGSLDILTGFTPAPGDTFDILNFASASGAFDAVIGTPGADMAWDTSQLLQDGSLTVLSALLGDMDGDLAVTMADVSLFIQAITDRAGYDADGFFVDADFNGDVDGSGTFDLGDLGALSVLMSSSASASTVPEPSAFTLVGLGLLGLVVFGRFRGNVSRLLTGRIALTASVFAMTAYTAQGATITSAPFSFGYGFTGSWNDSETSGTNTSTTLGDFSFSPAPTGPQWSSTGATFASRVLADGALDGNVSAFIDDAPFELPITASYIGPVPGDASGTPDYKLTVEITSISIYGGAHPSSSLFTLAWDETTAGNATTSPSVALTPSTSYEQVSAYTQLVWDAPDYEVSLAGLNDPFTRTFDILGGNGFRFGDGIEVEGQVVLTYNVVGPATHRWQTNGFGDWNLGGNWDILSVPNSNMSTVVFGTDVNATTTVVTNASVTANIIQFDNANGYVVAGAGSVNLQASTGNASVDVVQGDHQFQAVVNLSSETDVNVISTASLVFYNALNLGANNLNKTGAGILHINNALNTGSGTVNGLAGTISGVGLVSGDLNNVSATVAPGNSAGKLSVAGNYTQETGASLSLEIGGTMAGTEHDVLNVTGALTINGGDLDVVLIDGFVPDPGDTFHLLDFNSASGGFAAENLATLSGGRAWDSSNLLTTGELLVISEVLGDMNGDLLVNADDASLFVQALTDRASYDANSFPLDADFNGNVNQDFTFDLGDLSMFSGLLGGLASALAVPEPSSATLLGVSLGLMVLTGNRRQW